MLDEDGLETEVHTGLGVLEDSPSTTPTRPRSPVARDQQVGSAICSKSVCTTPQSTNSTQLDLFAPGTVAPKQPIRPVEVGGPAVDKAGAMPKQFSLADEDDYEELGLSRDNSAVSPTVHPAFKSD